VEDIGLAYPLKQQNMKKNVRQIVVLISFVSGALPVAEIEKLLLSSLYSVYQYRLGSGDAKSHGVCKDA
jgi:hypothetical protein